MKETSRKHLGFLPRLGKHPYLEVFEQVTYDVLVTSHRELGLMK